MALVYDAVQHYLPIIEFRRRSHRTEPARKGKIMNLARTYNNWVKYRQTVTELGRMTNRELSDLGIARQDIRRVARQAAF